MTNKKHIQAMIERIFFSLVVLNFLDIRKVCRKPQQVSLKPPTKNDTVSFREPASCL